MVVVATIEIGPVFFLLSIITIFGSDCSRADLNGVKGHIWLADGLSSVIFDSVGTCFLSNSVHSLSFMVDNIQHLMHI